MITKPTLLIDKSRCLDNIHRMTAKAQRNRAVLRPHFKTHQSLEISQWFKASGVDRITVSSVEMAQYFADEWNDITIAFPVNILEIDAIYSLATKIDLNLLVESVEVVDFLSRHLHASVGLFIKIDVGTHRTGVASGDLSSLDQILDCIDNTDNLNFKGFLAHAGHTYHSHSFDEIGRIHKQSINSLTKLKTNYLNRYPHLIISLGDTPSCSIMEDFSQVDEIRPGNFIFYDLMQLQIGSCTADQIAMAVACPIVAKHATRHELVIYGGGIHFSKERISYLEDHDIYGHVVERNGDQWGSPISDMYIRSLSQEHGIVVVPESLFDSFQIGELIYVLPVHSCMTMNLMREFLVVPRL